MTKKDLAQIFHCFLRVRQHYHMNRTAGKGEGSETMRRQRKSLPMLLNWKRLKWDFLEWKMFLGG